MSDAVAVAMWLDDSESTNRQSMQTEVGDWSCLEGALGMDQEELQALDLQIKHDKAAAKKNRELSKLAIHVKDPGTSHARIRLRTQEANYTDTIDPEHPDFRRAVRQRVAANRKRKRFRVLLRPTKRTIPLDENEWLSFNTY